VKVILHIGGEKTGTTTIQSGLLENAELLESNQILYPRFPEWLEGPTHAYVAAAFLPAHERSFVSRPLECPSPEQVREKLTRCRERFNTVIISDEHLSSRLQIDEITKLSETLSPFSVEIIYYARRQDELLLSWFSTAILNGLPDWLHSEEIERYFLGLFDHSRILDLWSAAFPSARFHVVDYNAIPDRDAWRRFLNLVDLSQIEIKPPNHINNSKPYDILRLVYLLNKKYSPARRLDTAEDISRLRRYLEVLNDALLSIEPRLENKQPLKLDQSILDHVLKHFADSNKVLSQRYGVGRDWSPRSAPMAAVGVSDSKGETSDIDLLTDALFVLASELFAAKRKLSELERVKREWFEPELQRLTKALEEANAALAKLQEEALALELRIAEHLESEIARQIADISEHESIVACDGAYVSQDASHERQGDSVKIVEYIEGLFSHSGIILAKSMKLWRSGIDYEIGFWTKWFATRGLEWSEDYIKRMSPQPLAPWLVSLLPLQMDRIAHVLDVGAGPVTKTGQFVEGREIVFAAVDPLAPFYDQIIDQQSVKPPTRTQIGFAEDLSARFAPNSIDLISCTNALDHAIEPVWGIIEMLQVVTSTGNVFLGHRRNEAEFENYSGLHQWNFDVERDNFIVWNRDRRVDVTELLAGFADVQCRVQGDYLSVILTKRRELPVDPLQYNRRLRAGILSSLIMQT